jgi:hypothetical protein
MMPETFFFYVWFKTSRFDTVNSAFFFWGKCHILGGLRVRLKINRLTRDLLMFLKEEGRNYHILIILLCSNNKNKPCMARIGINSEARACLGLPGEVWGSFTGQVDARFDENILAMALALPRSLWGGRSATLRRTAVGVPRSDPGPTCAGWTVWRVVRVSVLPGDSLDRAEAALCRSVTGQAWSIRARWPSVDEEQIPRCCPEYQQMG